VHGSELLKDIRVGGCSLPDDFVTEVCGAENFVEQHAQVVARRRVAMQVEAARLLENVVKLQKPRRHHREIGHHR